LREKLEEILSPYGEVIKTEGRVYIELVDDEGDLYGRLAFYVEDVEGNWGLVGAVVEAIKDLTDHDVPSRNVFAFGFRPKFKGETMRLTFLGGERGRGAVIGRVPENVLRIAEKNTLRFQGMKGKELVSRGTSMGRTSRPSSS